METASLQNSVMLKSTNKTINLHCIIIKTYITFYSFFFLKPSQVAQRSIQIVTLLELSFVTTFSMIIAKFPSEPSTSYTDYWTSDIFQTILL